MKLYKVGDRSKAMCPFCRGLKSTTFAERNVPLSGGQDTVKDVLVAVCDDCDRVVSTPQQSAPRIQEVLQKVRKPLEARIPRQLSDAMGIACTMLGFSVHESLQTILFRFFLKRVAERNSLVIRLPALARDEDAKGRATARLTVELSEPLSVLLAALEAKTSLNKSEVARGILVQMKHELLDKEDRELRKELHEIMTVAGA